MGETLASDETMVDRQELERQRDEFLRRATVLRELLDTDDLSCAEIRADAEITLRAPEGWKFSVFRNGDESSHATIMGRFSDFDSSVGNKDFDSGSPLEVDRITATLQIWPSKSFVDLVLNFVTDDPTYYTTYTSHDDIDKFVINVARRETEAS